MSREGLLFASYILIFFHTCRAGGNNDCPPSFCGNIPNISYPFRLQNDPPHCGNLHYTLSCENNFTVLYLTHGKYLVQAINYHNSTIRLVDSSIQKDNCSSLPRFPLTTNGYRDDFYFFSPDIVYKFNQSFSLTELSTSIVFTTCARPAVNSTVYVDTASCIGGAPTSNSSPPHLKTYSYVIVGTVDGYWSASDLMESCCVDMMTLLPKKNYEHTSYVEIHRELTYGFQLSWAQVHCGDCVGTCYLDLDEDTSAYKCDEVYSPESNQTYEIRVMFAGKEPFALSVRLPTSRFLELSFPRAEWLLNHLLIPLGLARVAFPFLGVPCVIAFLIHKWRRRHLSVYDTIEEFLQNHNGLMPIRYSYTDIKRMTAGFRDKLGEGGFGCVYKGKLRSGHFAAIKMLSKSKGTGQDFINEVATIGRIHHANVVQLIGFCAEGSKCALVYDFMPNGSLDKYIFSREGFDSLGWAKMFEISIGVARGIEYLHRGCEMQILHFDIKPHNILLDKNFNPKVSDFGLAKLYATNDSIATLTAARGTLGYMAPELFYKNIGRVSYKADVYSYGMLLLEVTGKRKNLNAFNKNSSQIYFPSWVHDQVTSGEDIEIGDATDEETKMVKKMIMLGLWCIQMKPSDRPAMNKVVEMLEGDLESLELPPKPILYPVEAPIQGGGESSHGGDSSVISDDFCSSGFTETISLIENAG